MNRASYGFTRRHRFRTIHCGRTSRRVNYLFDAEKLMIRTGWTGGFINVTGTVEDAEEDFAPFSAKSSRRGPRSHLEVRQPGQNSSNQIPRVFPQGKPNLSLRGGRGKDRANRNRSSGKERAHPRLPCGKGKRDLFYLMDSKGLLVSSTAGKWHPEKGYVRIPAKEASEFFISIEQNL